MLQFINDWHGNPEKFILNTHENKEYPINAWIAASGGRCVYLASAYVYDEYVMFFYMYDLRYHPEHGKRQEFVIPSTQREAIEFSNKHKDFFIVDFEYEVNSFKSGRGSVASCLPCLVPKDVREAEQDVLAKMQLGEYDYLLNLVNETDIIPHELIGAELAFAKACYSFGEPILSIENIAVYPQTHKFRNHTVNKSFTIPFGECDIKVSYKPKGAEESYIIIKKLEFHNMMDDFNKNYERLKETHTTACECNENAEILTLDEVKRYYNQTILLLSFLAPEEKRSFEFYTTKYLESEIVPAEASTTGIALIAPHADNKSENGLYRRMASVGTIKEEPKKEYEIILMSVTDCFLNERTAIFEWEVEK